MVTSYFIAYCMTGVYQLIVLYMMGPIIPILHNTLKLPRGYGIRNTVSLLQMRQSVDNALAVYVGGVKIPVLTLIVIALACLFIVWFRRTKLGQDMRAVGQDMNVARDAGINVDRTRLISIVMSTVFAGFGMIIYLQNMGNFPTYTAHTNIGMFCIAALLVGGASVEKGVHRQRVPGRALVPYHVHRGAGRRYQDHRRLHDRRVFPRVRVLRRHHRGAGDVRGQEAQGEPHAGSAAGH